jgi:hypothetical protein
MHSGSQVSFGAEIARPLRTGSGEIAHVLAPPNGRPIRNPRRIALKQRHIWRPRGRAFARTV